MRVGQSHGGSAIAGGAELVADAAVLREHLREVLESPAFRGSRRCQQFLQHVVEKAIGSHYDELKERILGVELFGCSSVYDTGEAAIGRVTSSLFGNRPTAAMCAGLNPWGPIYNSPCEVSAESTCRSWMRISRSVSPDWPGHPRRA